MAVPQSSSRNRAPRFRTCLYVGDIHRQLRGRTGHARPATDADGAGAQGLWAFQAGGEGDVVWVRTNDLSFVTGKKAKR